MSTENFSYENLMDDLKKRLEKVTFKEVRKYAEDRLRLEEYNEYQLLYNDPHYIRKFESGNIEYISPETYAIETVYLYLDIALNETNIIDDMERFRYELLNYLLFERPDIMAIISQEDSKIRIRYNSQKREFFRATKVINIFKKLSEANKKKLLSEGKFIDSRQYIEGIFSHTDDFTDYYSEDDFFDKLAYYMQFLELDRSRVEVIDNRKRGKRIDKLENTLQEDESINSLIDKSSNEGHIVRLAKLLKSDELKKEVINNKLTSEEYITRLAETLQSDELKMEVINNKLTSEEYITRLAKTLQSDELIISVIKERLTSIEFITKLICTLKAFEYKFQMLVGYYNKFSESHKESILNTMSDKELRDLILDQNIQNIEFKELALQCIKDNTMKSTLKLIVSAQSQLQDYYYSTDSRDRQAVIAQIAQTTAIASRAGDNIGELPFFDDVKLPET